MPARRSPAIPILAGLALTLAGIVNLTAGLLGLFPGLFEAALAEGRAEGDGPIGLLALLGTPYGRYALAHLAGGLLQILGGSWFVWLLRSRFVHAVAGLCVLSVGLELWGWVLKGSLTPLSAPGLVAAALAAGVYVRRLRT